MLDKLCPPALIYVLFSITQIVIDVSKGLYNTAFVKMWVSFVVTFLLNYLCESGLGVISWFMVFIPFVLMTLIISILLFVFGLDPQTGKLQLPTQETQQQSYSDLDMRAQVLAEQTTIPTETTQTTATSDAQETNPDTVTDNTEETSQDSKPKLSEFQKALETIQNTIQGNKDNLIPSFSSTVITTTVKDGSKQSSSSMY